MLWGKIPEAQAAKLKQIGKLNLFRIYHLYKNWHSENDEQETESNIFKSFF